MRPIAEGLRSLVKGRVLDSSEVEPERTTNFGHVFTARPGAVLEPAHAEDVAGAIRFARNEGIPVSVRGAAHSQSQIAISNGGLLIDMRSMGRIGPVARGASSVEVEGGAVWRDVVRATLQSGLAPPVLTNNLSVTVGGTLSTAGVGVASHRYGTQGDQVEELTVVLGTGEIRTCGPERDPDLFWAVIAGLGQVGVIASARLKLRSVRPMTRTYYLLYDDVHRFMEDTKTAMDSERWDHLESWASPSPQGTKPVSGRRQVFARWFFPFHPTVEFDEGSPPDDRALLDGLHPYDHLYTDDLPTLDFFERLEDKRTCVIIDPICEPGIEPARKLLHLVPHSVCRRDGVGSGLQRDT